jgi:mRNA-degrading endonuclease RelE of RelBE toxin-antitoxin system
MSGQTTVKLHKDFEKQLSKLPPKLRAKVIDCIEIFLQLPTEPSLRNHAYKAYKVKP